jgi:two-component system, NarL family, nitrate/nitrite response regulator NarL
MKGITGSELVNAISAVSNGARYITPDLAWRLIMNPPPHSTAHEVGDRPHLSIRERQVLGHASKGLTNQEIARTLGLTSSTIKYYKSVAYKKMGVRNRVEAIVAAEGLAK